MTANLVTGFGPMKDIMSQATAGIGSTGGAEFSDILKNSTGREQDVPKAKDVQPVNRAEANTSKKDQIESPDETDNTETVRSDKPNEVKADKPDGVDDSQKMEAVDDADSISEETIETIQTAVLSMVGEIAQTFDVTVNDVEAAVEAIGIDEVEVLDSSMIPSIAVELTDATDTYDIMTDEKLFEDVKMLMEEAKTVTSELAEELDMTPEKLQETIGDMLAAKEVPDEVVEVRDKGITVENAMDDSLNESGEMNAVADETVVVNDTAAKSNQTKQGTERDASHHGEGSQLTQTLADNLKEVMSEKVQEAPVAYATNAEQIMEQVSENLKLTMTEDITEMEMQLNPASLGNIKVQVAAKDGVITASFTTQNEEVKAALETQLVQLRDQMNEQGIKVAAVEVTVSSHAFERNLNEEGSRDNGGSEAEAKKKRVRGINLSGIDLDEMDELIDEEDKVVADMMARQGNTVDYMA